MALRHCEQALSQTGRAEIKFHQNFLYSFLHSQSFLIVFLLVISSLSFLFFCLLHSISHWQVDMVRSASREIKHECGVLSLHSDKDILKYVITL